MVKGKIGNKLADTRGETLAEVLVASLIAGVGMLVLASMIMVSHKMIDRSEAAMQTFYEGASKVEAQAESTGKVRIEIKKGNSVITTVSPALYEDKETGLAAYRLEQSGTSGN